MSWLLKYGDRKKAFFLFILLASALFYHSFNHFEESVHFQKHEQLLEFGSAHIQEAKSKALTTFLLLSEIKASIAILQSSHVGASFIVDFRVQLGQLLQSLQETLTHAWQFSLISLSVLESMNLILESCKKIHIREVWDLLLWSLTGFYFIKVLSPKWSLALIPWVRFIAASLLALFLLIPSSVALSGYLSKELLFSEIDHLHENMAKDHNHLNLSTAGQGGLASLSYSTIRGYEDDHSKVQTSLSGLTNHLTRHIAMILFQILVFPILTAAFWGVIVYEILRQLGLTQKRAWSKTG